MTEEPGASPLQSAHVPAGGDADAGLTARPAEPLSRMTARALHRIARRADRHRRRDVSRFEVLSGELGVSPRQLRLLADAWAEGGRSGVRAIGPAGTGDPALMDRADAVIETWRRRHFPLDALATEIWRDRITVWRLTPGHDRSGRLERHPLMQLRLTTDGRWHLYRRAAQGEWWPVVVRSSRRRQSLSACLDAVRVDLLHHFWGSGGPPTDLAHGDAMPDPPIG